jgi:hypothetical protein
MTPEEPMILVPEAWLQELLELALKLEKSTSGAETNLSIEAACLMGYAKSASAILKYNERK